MATAAKSASASDKSGAPEESAAAPPPPKRKLGALPLLLGSVLLSAAVASGATWFISSRHAAPAKHAAKADAAKAEKAAEDEGDKAAGEEGDKPAAQQPALYLDMTPAFVVNLADEEAMRFLQVEVQVMARDPKVIDAVKTHTPRIRNALMLLFSQLHARDIGSREAKEALQKQALDEVQKALQAENEPAEVGAVYFTSFVMQ